MYKKTMIVIANGEEIELYTIGHTAKILKKSVETIRAWERQKVIPPPMYKSKQVRLYHPLEVEAMRKVIRRLGKYAKKQDVQKHMWIAIRDARKEILNGPTKPEEDHQDGSDVRVPSSTEPDSNQQENEQTDPPALPSETEVPSPGDVLGMFTTGDNS